MHTVTKKRALDALEGMRQIVSREMLVKGSYIEDEVSNPRLTGAICGGRRHCAIGSLWAGAGVRARIVGFDPWFSAELPGVDESDRPAFLRRRPSLRAALAALNTAAHAFADTHGIQIADHWDDAIEGLFEGHYGAALTKRDLLKVISAAKRIVRAG